MSWRFMILYSTLFTLTWATPPRTSKTNFYNFRTDFDDDQNFATFEGDTNGNYVSEFGQRIGSGSGSSLPELDQTDEIIDYSDNVIPVEEEETLSSGSDGRRLKTTWMDSQRSGDAAYSFGYDLPDQSRHETSDSFGNINGVYSYIDDEGVYRHVSYSAGAGTGFVVHNKHATLVRPSAPYRKPGIPDSPKSYPRRPTGGWDEDEQLYPIGPTRPTLAELQPQHWAISRRRKPAYVPNSNSQLHPSRTGAWAYFRQPNPSRIAPSRGGGWTPAPKPQRPVKIYPQEESFGSDGHGWSEPDRDSGSSYSKDASYSFGFDAGDHNRHEVSDPWGNVRGSYSYIDPDGIRRTVHYSASSATGFKILKAEPSNVVPTVYRDPSHPRQRPPQQRPQQPSAFVYHLHPDGGWKPWEASNGRTPQPNNNGKPRRPHNSVSQSYHYQTQNIGKKSNEDQHTLLTPTMKRQKRPGTEQTTIRAQKSNLEEQPIPDQHYSDLDYENQDVAEARFESQRNDGETDVGESKGPEIRGYRGGYGDKNPLLVVSESTSRSRTTIPENNEDDEKQMMKQPEVESQTKGPISIGKMLSMRMSTSQKKSKRRNSSRKSESVNNENGPTMMTNSGRLMHYPKSQFNNNGDK